MRCFGLVVSRLHALTKLLCIEPDDYLPGYCVEVWFIPLVDKRVGGR